MFSAPRRARAQEARPGWLKNTMSPASSALWLAGEPLDEPTAQWISDALQVPIIDNYWQTETGWPILTPTVWSSKPRALAAQAKAMYNG